MTLFDADLVPQDFQNDLLLFQSDDKVMAIVYTFIFIIGVCANLVVIIVIGLDPQGCDKYLLMFHRPKPLGSF